MGGRIFIEHYGITEDSAKTSSSRHMLLVYQNESGDEFIIRGGQEHEDPIGTIYGKIAGYGPILVEDSVPTARSRDGDNRIIHKTKENRRELTPVELGGRDASEVWKQMTQKAQEIKGQNIEYKLTGPNSNSTIAAVLKSVGINILDVLPEGRTDINFPGVHDTLDNPDDTGSGSFWDFLGLGSSKTSPTSPFLSGEWDDIPKVRVPTTQGLGEALQRKRQQTLEDALFNVITGATKSRSPDFNPAASGRPQPFENVPQMFMGIFENVVAKALHNERRRVATSETARSSELQNSFRLSRSQQAAQLAQLVAMGQRNL